MNRRIASLLVVCAAALALLTLGLRSSQAQGGSARHDFAVGGFTTIFEEDYGFAAQLNPNTGDVRGHVVLRRGPFYANGHVVCLLVDGTNARLTWEVRSSNDPGLPEGSRHVLNVTDGGEPQLGVSPDSFDAAADGGVGCDHTRRAFFQILQGNIVVNDGTP